MDFFDRERTLCDGEATKARHKISSLDIEILQGPSDMIFDSAGFNREGLQEECQRCVWSHECKHIWCAC